ncbi:glutamine amidotransferase-related protein, partial [Acinetobacter seifertii]
YALGAKVYAGHQKEIGWSPLSLSLRPNQVLSPLLNNVHVLHWHGDTFDLPENAALLASSDIYTNQAFEVGNNILALQFHIETTEEHFEKWLIGHTCELRSANISIQKLREENKKYAQNLEHAAFEIIQKFLKRIGYST